MKTLVILQSNYLPWRGYFDLIATADEFRLFDEVQYTRRDWRNRNYVVLDGRRHLLTIPVETKGRYAAPIREIRVADAGWARRHHRTILEAYRRAPFIDRYRDGLADLYARAADEPMLSAINRMFLEALCGWLDIATPLLDTDGVPRGSEDPTARLVEICVACGATRYLSGPAAQAYIRPELFAAAGVELSWADYGGYAPYPQRTEAFDPGVSMLDALMMAGPAARGLLKAFTPGASLIAPAR